jgi:hypothetical protein
MRLIAVILPYAVSIRDFVHTGTLAELLRIPDVRIQIYTVNPDLPELEHLRSERVVITEMAGHKSRGLEAFLRNLYPFLFYDVFVHVQIGVDRKWSRRLPAKLLAGIRRVLGTRAALRLYGWLLMRAFDKRQPRQIEGEPDLVIGTRSLIHSIDFAMIMEANHRGLRQLTAAGSWDNFTTKGFFPFPVERTIVWNRQMAKELVEIFEVPEEHIVIAGYPRVKLLQHEVAGENPETYLRRIGLGRYRRFVLHTASYAELTRGGPDQPPAEYLLIREVALALAPLLPEDTCIIVRLHPYAKTDDEVILAGLPKVHVFVPGRQDRYVERVMSEEDEAHLSAQLRLSECIISMASTITIDALTLQRPIINLGFNVAGTTSPEASITRFYAFNHIRDLVAQVKPPIARNVEEVVAFVLRCVAGDQTTGVDLEAFERCYVPADSRNYSTIVRQTASALLDRDTDGLQAPPSSSGAPQIPAVDCAAVTREKRSAGA